MEKVISSAYLEYVHEYFDATAANLMSKACVIKLEITGEQGLPCGSSLL